MLLLIKCCYANEDALAFILTNTNYSHSLGLSEALLHIKIHKDLLKQRRSRALSSSLRHGRRENYNYNRSLESLRRAFFTFCLNRRISNIMCLQNPFLTTEMPFNQHELTNMSSQTSGPHKYHQQMSNEMSTET